MLTQNYRSIPIIDRFTKKSFFRCRTQGVAPLGRFNISKENHYFSRCPGIKIPGTKDSEKTFGKCRFFNPGKGGQV